MDSPLSAVAARHTLPPPRSRQRVRSRWSAAAPQQQQQPRQTWRPAPSPAHHWVAADQQQAWCRRRLAAAAIKGVEAFDGNFELDEKQQATLNELLYSNMFCQQVARECKVPEGTVLEFTGVLFQPTPWSVTTKKGMPAVIEAEYHGKEEYTFINVPPVFMFQAKIFAPPRLCAIYRCK